MAEATPTDVNDPSLASDLVQSITTVVDGPSLAPVTAAIDFGTTSSGFAFKFGGPKDTIQINKWVEGASDVEKTSTTVLLMEDKTFHSFGFDAETTYASLCQKQKQKGWRYFHHFKMALYRNEKITRYMPIYDTENKPMAALDVLSIVLRYLKDKILEKVRLQRPEIADDEVKYVITVPAVWSDAAKQMMREAATHQSVGIRDDRLKLVLEPEAASVYCALQPTERRQASSDGHSFQPLPKGSKYIIVDIGGGTLDIAAHEILPDNHLHEISVARGNDMGGHYFNNKCMEVFQEMFGTECLEKWKTTYCNDFLNMEKKIEEMKRNISINNDDVQFRIDRSLSSTYTRISDGKNIKYFEFRFNKFVESSRSRKGYLTLKIEILINFVKQVARAIETYLTEIITHVPSIQTIFMVGGLAKSTFVRQYIEDKFPQCRVIVPEDPGVAVLKGAVLLGNRPQTIASRVARYSYGINAMDDFVEGKHREEYKVTEDGEVNCDHVFTKLIEKGQVLQYGQRFTTTTCVNAVLPETKQKTYLTYLFQSTQPSPMYVTEDGCCELGGFEMHPPEGGWPDYCEVKTDIIVGEAEFRLVVSDDIGRNYESKIDFLKP